MAEQVAVTSPDSSTREVATGTTPADIAAAIGVRLAKDAIATRVDGDWVDDFIARITTEVATRA